MLKLYEAFYLATEAYIQTIIKLIQHELDGDSILTTLVDRKSNKNRMSLGLGKERKYADWDPSEIKISQQVWFYGFIILGLYEIE